MMETEGFECGTPTPRHLYAGCQGFHHVTQILPIQGNGSPLSASSRFYSGELVYLWLVGPKRCLFSSLGQAIVASCSIP
jgi:hypothetical protein